LTGIAEAVEKMPPIGDPCCLRRAMPSAIIGTEVYLMRGERRPETALVYGVTIWLIF